jgi:AraC family transcriptional regulator
LRIAYRHIRPATVLYARGTGDYWSASNDAWARLDRWLGQHKERRQIKRGFGLFHDNPQITPSELLRYDACVELMTCLDAEPAVGIGRQTVTGGTYAVHTHVGSYAPIGGLFSELHREWVRKQGLVVDYDRPFMAVYLNDPHITREVHRRTELCIPVLPLREQLPPDTDNEDDQAASALTLLAAGYK